jgi:acetyltransferase-like isoleucine patch superfamily enzyme
MGKISIGDNCVISENNVLYGAGEIEIGNTTGTGPGVMIFSSRSDYSLKYAKLSHSEVPHYFGKVTIGSYVTIYANVVIAPGVTIGDGVVIAACSFVGTDIPPWTVAAGNPARVVGSRKINIPLKKKLILR